MMCVQFSYHREEDANLTCPSHLQVSWGTKGSTTVATDLGVVKTSGGGNDKVDVDIPSDERDIDAAYEDAKHLLAQAKPKVVTKVDAQERMEASYKNIRLNVRRSPI